MKTPWTKCDAKHCVKRRLRQFLFKWNVLTKIGSFQRKCVLGVKANLPSSTRGSGCLTDCQWPRHWEHKKSQRESKSLWSLLLYIIFPTSKTRPLILRGCANKIPTSIISNMTSARTTGSVSWKTVAFLLSISPPSSRINATRTKVLTTFWPLSWFLPFSLSLPAILLFPPSLLYIQTQNMFGRI